MILQRSCGFMDLNLNEIKRPLMFILPTHSTYLLTQIEQRSVKRKYLPTHTCTLLYTPLLKYIPTKYLVKARYVFRPCYYLTYVYFQGRPSNQCHRAMALVVFCPAPNFKAYIEYPVTKSLETPNWHWLISFPMGALARSSTS